MSSKESVSSAKDQSITAAGGPGLVEEGKPQISIRDADRAYNFLASVNVNPEDVLSVDLRRLRRRIDYRLIPFLWLCYTMAWLDKAILNYANVMGLPRDLRLRGNNFSNANTFFYVALTLAELPTGLILNKVSARKWMGINTILWGAATCAVAASQGYQSLLATRILVGIFEAAIVPCLLLFVSQWYTKSEQSPRFCFWYAGLGTGQIVGGLQSFGFQFVTNTTFQGWRIMFVVMGGATIFIGFFVLFFVAENPMEAKWLTDAEKTALLNHISINQTGVINTRFVWSQAVELLMDLSVWWISIATVLLTISSGVVSSYSATLLANFGYTPKESALILAAGGFISIAAVILSGWGVRRTSNRWAWIAGLVLPGILGAGLFSFMPRNNKSAILAGIYLVNVCTAGLPHIFQWVASNVAGHTKRSLATGIIAASFGAGSAIGPQIFQAKDAPLYQPARITILATLSAGTVMVALLALYYKLENLRRDKKQAVNGVSITEEEKWGNLTDRQNPSFRYVL